MKGIIYELRLKELENGTIEAGFHETSNKRCSLEWVAYLANEPHTDNPACVSDVLSAFVRTVNDIMFYEERQKLKPVLPKLVGTAGSEAQEQARAYRLADWAVRVLTPLVLKTKGNPVDAALLRSLKPVVDEASAKAAIHYCWRSELTGEAAGVAAREAASSHNLMAAYSVGDAVHSAFGAAPQTRVTKEILKLLWEETKW